MPEELDQTIEDDKNLVKETNFVLAKHFDNYEKCILTFYKITLVLNNTKSHPTVEKLIQRSNCIKFCSPITSTQKRDNHIPKLTQFRLDEDIKNKLKYFNPPRFLIVEDNAFGRTNLIDRLKEQKFNYLIDIAAFGSESIQKYKFFLNKGYNYYFTYSN
jgi:hypothetical protein